MAIGIVKNYLNKIKTMVMNSTTFKIPIQQDEDTGNEFYYIKDPYFDCCHTKVICNWL